MLQESVEFEICIRCNVVTGAFELIGLGKNRLVELGMLEYAKTRLQRIDAQIQMQEMMANAPRVFPGSLPLMKGPQGL